MARNPKAQDNLRAFPKGVSGNPAGRPKSLAKMIRDLPTDAQTEILGVLAHAISLSSISEAKEYIKGIEDGKISVRYGVVLQIALKSLTGPFAWNTLNDILDRLFGKPRVQAEVSHNGGIQLHVHTDGDTKDIIEGGIG